MPSSTAMDLFTYLWCIIVNDELKVLIQPFQLLVPRESSCDIFFVHLRIAVPLLRNQEVSTLTLHKPNSVISSEQDTLTQLNNAEVNLGRSVEPTDQVQHHFPFVSTSGPGQVSAIICLNHGGGKIPYYQLITVFDAFPQM